MRIMSSMTKRISGCFLKERTTLKTGAVFTKNLKAKSSF